MSQMFRDPISNGSTCFSNILFIAFSTVYEVNYIVNLTDESSVTGKFLTWVSFVCVGADEMCYFCSLGQFPICCKLAPNFGFG